MIFKFCKERERITFPYLEYEMKIVFMANELLEIIKVSLGKGMRAAICVLIKSVDIRRYRITGIHVICGK